MSETDADGYKVTRYETGDGVAVVTLNRPDRLNAWTNRMEHELRGRLANAQADPAVRGVVITGAGRGFCAGADFEALSQMAGSGEYDLEGGPSELPRPQPSAVADFTRTYSYLLGLGKPIIAAVNGPAAGVGF